MRRLPWMAMSQKPTLYDKIRRLPDNYVLAI